MKVLNTPAEEARRIKTTEKTLANQRWRGDGPPFLKIGRSIRYDPELTDAWLAERIRCSTSQAA